MRIGVDVGGTNTDAVLMDGRRVLSSVKKPASSEGLYPELRQGPDLGGDYARIFAGQRLRGRTLVRCAAPEFQS